jgi:hypothetical protein
MNGPLIDCVAGAKGLCALLTSATVSTSDLLSLRVGDG